MAASQVFTKYGNRSETHYVDYSAAGKVLYSYGSPIACETSDGSILLHPDYWNYSTTTNYYRGQFLGEGVAATRKKIESGEYKLERFH
jgi:hypothetical protein